MKADVGSMKLVVGCPVRRREWVAQAWINHVAWATVEAGFKDSDVEFVFVSHPDDPTNGILSDAASVFGVKTTFLDDPEIPTELKRHWSGDRIKTMVRVRNTLLDSVRAKSPDLFLSLDSDILMNVKSLKAMLRLFRTSGHRETRPDVTSHCVHLHPMNTDFPNYAMIKSNGGLQRPMVEGELANVHVLMAAKLMTPNAYNVNYEYDGRGEDIGWSNAVRTKGMHLAWTGKVVSKHCMKASHLDSVDPRCGY